MTNSNTDINSEASEVKKAADNVEPKAVAENLNNADQTPKDLEEDQKTPFIDDELRTDK